MIRHAQAATVRVEAGHEAGRLRLRFHDDGLGMPQRPRVDGHGVAHIARRAEALGARLAWLPGPGTTLQLEMAAGEGAAVAPEADP